MTSLGTMVVLVAHDAEVAVRAMPHGTSLGDRLRAAFKAARAHYMAPSETDQFNGAMQGCARACTEEERERLNEDVRRANLLSAMLNGVPVDFDAVDLDDGPEPVGAMRIWRETAA